MEPLIIFDGEYYLCTECGTEFANLAEDNTCPYCGTEYVDYEMFEESENK